MKDNFVVIRVTSVEKKKIKSMANRKKIPISELIRQAVLAKEEPNDIGQMMLTSDISPAIQKKDPWSDITPDEVLNMMELP